MPPLAPPSTWPSQSRRSRDPPGRNRGGDVLGRSQPLQRVHPGHPLDQFGDLPFRKRSVAVGPGATALTVMPAAQLLDMIAVSVSTAALVAA